MLDMNHDALNVLVLVQNTKHPKDQDSSRRHFTEETPESEKNVMFPKLFMAADVSVGGLGRDRGPRKVYGPRL